MSLTVKSKSASGFTLNLDAMPNESKNYKVKVKAVLEDGTELQSEKQIAVTAIPVNVITITGADSITALNSAKNYTIAFSSSTGSTPNIEVESVQVSSNVATDILEVTKTDDTHFSLKMVGASPSVMNATITVKATLVNGSEITQTKDVTLKIVPTSFDIYLNGATVLEAKNGSGSINMYFRFTPAQYNVPVSIKSVTTDLSTCVASNISIEGYTLTADGVTESGTVRITAVATIDGVDKTLIKDLTFVYSKEVNANGFEYVDLGLPSGRLWCKHNVGAESDTDCGLYFQWGDTEGYTKNTSDGKNFSWNSYKYGSAYNNLYKYSDSIDKKTTLDITDDAAAKYMNGDWRMPDNVDIDELLNKSNCTNEWTIIDGVKGLLFTSVRNGNTLFLPAFGYRYNNDLWNYNSVIHYWSRSLASSNSSGFKLFSNINSSYLTSEYRYMGLNIRGVI